ncbi:hypothetical protein ETAA8_27220 [Anatilimnocola aggregata]|uniref:3-keto-alpha-glucoside-1,2-lyase/3-keto-2-hydroxy-glucal hydratase domain-containing protein n=1 Tax=Anatilimnocola aggregata TaxID=2528021 RepID=A0A517YBN8_9BACT|nr:DUF1080 domain-containing protein [Anatilimnocola aggregata]QDU27634.1 hypothetical protein ETAA8_27220 [Anatilimnocola aggregata]
MKRFALFAFVLSTLAPAFAQNVAPPKNPLDTRKGDAPVVSKPREAAEQTPNTLSDKEKQEGWKLLFDGKTTTGWRNYKKTEVGPGWQVKNGELTRADKGAGDIITNDKFTAFELVLEYKISKGGNSGLMFHVTEEGNTPWMTGPEIQVQDNVDGHDPQKAGWLYQLYKPEADATKPVGQWNELRVKITPEKSTVWMNGTKYYDFVKGSKEWDEKVAASKFGKMPLFGKPTSGHLSLQDHGNEVAFRNIKIRPIESK